MPPRARTPATPAEVEVEVTPPDDLGPSGVRSLEPEPDPEPDYDGVDEVEQPRDDIATTQNFYGGHPTQGVNEVVEIQPEILEGDEPTYRIRLTQDIDTIFIGIDNPIPPMKKDVLYEVNQRVYDYLLPKGLIQGK
jgi:hypothetical protein